MQDPQVSTVSHPGIFVSPFLSLIPGILISISKKTSWQPSDEKQPSDTLVPSFLVPTHLLKEAPGILLYWATF